MNLTEIGSIAGLLSAIFLVWDRFLTGQPVVWQARKPEFAPPIRYLRCANLAKWDILIKKIKVVPNILSIARDESAQAITDARYNLPNNLPFFAVIPAGATRDFPLGINEAATMPETPAVAMQEPAITMNETTTTIQKPAATTIQEPAATTMQETTRRRCVIIVSWRSARSTGLPKFPVIVFSSVETIRAIDQLT